MYKFQVYILSGIDSYLTFCNIPVLTENQPIQQIVLGVFLVLMIRF